MTGKDDNAIVLDFLPNGYPFDSKLGQRKTPIVQAIGKNSFAILELVPRKDAALKSGDEIYIGEGKREQIHHVLGRIPLSKLTQTARGELEFVLKDLIDKNKQKYLDFFNKSGAISTRMHQLELLPGIGKKHMWEIIERRNEKLFESFEDISNRVKLLPNPEKAILKRILAELNDEDKYKLFT